MPIEVLHGGHVACQEQFNVIPMGQNVHSNAKHFHCSWHATWPPCKTSIAGICPFKETFEIHDFIKPKKTRQIAHYVYMNELALRAL